MKTTNSRRRAALVDPAPWAKPFQPQLDEAVRMECARVRAKNAYLKQSQVDSLVDAQMAGAQSAQREALAVEERSIYRRMSGLWRVLVFALPLGVAGVSIAGHEFATAVTTQLSIGNVVATSLIAESFTAVVGAMGFWHARLAERNDSKAVATEAIEQRLSEQQSERTHGLAQLVRIGRGELESYALYEAVFGAATRFPVGKYRFGAGSADEPSYSRVMAVSARTMAHYIEDKPAVVGDDRLRRQVLGVLYARSVFHERLMGIQLDAPVHRPTALKESTKRVNHFVREPALALLAT